MTLNEYSLVEEANDEGVFIPETKFDFDPIDQLGPYVNGKELVDVIGVVQNVSPTISIKRKINNDVIPKRDITIADESKKTVVVSLWNDHATTLGQELMDMADKSPVVAIKGVRVSDFLGVFLSAVSKNIIKVDPDLPESKKLKSWYDSEGKDAPMASASAGLSPSANGGGRSVYMDRVTISHITSNPSLGDEKVAYTIGGLVISADAIEHPIFGFLTTQVGGWSKTILSTAFRKKFAEEKQLISLKLGLPNLQSAVGFVLHWPLY